MKLSRRIIAVVVLLAAAAGGLFFAFREPRHLLSLDRPPELGKRLLFTLTGFAGGIRTLEWGLSVNDLDFSPDGKRLATSTWRRATLPTELQIRDTFTGKELLSIKETSSYGKRVAFSADGTRLTALGFENMRGNSMTEWDAATGQKIRTIGPVQTGGNEVVGAHGTRMAVHRPGGFEIWDIPSGQLLIELPVTNHAIFAFSPDGKLAAVKVPRDDQALRLQHPNEVKLFDTKTGEEVLTLKGGIDTDLRQMEFSRDGKRVASLSYPNRVKLWSATTGEPVPLKLNGDNGQGVCMAVSPDGSRIALECRSEIKVWDVASGEEQLTLKGFKGGVGCMRFSPDGNRLAAAALVGTALDLWDVSLDRRN